MKYETKIAQLLRVAEWRVTYCETIVSYASRMGKRDFDPSSDIDNFYRNVCVMAFNDALLILGSLLDDKDTRPLSFCGLDNLSKSSKVKLRSLKLLFELKGLGKIRNQIIAHQDKSNPFNKFPDARIKGHIHPTYVERTQTILLDLILLFLSHMKEINNPYDPEYFNNATAKKQIDTVMKSAKPDLTNDYVG